LQPSLFTRLLAVEAELQAMKTLVAKLEVNQDALRYDRDEWRWRAEQLLANQQRGTWWRWRWRIAAALDHAAGRYGSHAELRDKLLTAIKESWAVAPLRLGESAWHEDRFHLPNRSERRRGHARVES
jgi:hypothetical protein